MKKLAIVLCVSAACWGLSLPAYADDIVTFDVQVQKPIFKSEFRWGYPCFAMVDTDLQAGPAYFVQGIQFPPVLYQGTIINRFYPTQIMPYEQRQTQSGSFNLKLMVLGHYEPSVPYDACQGRWQHDFWMDKKGKHDRFYLTVSEPCSVSPANDPTDRNSGLHHSGDKYTISYRTWD